jgi:DNA-binding MltR family transcriptional regulator
VSDPAYLKAFKDYTRDDPTFHDLPAMEREFYGEADRPAAILQAAVVEEALKAAISRKLAPTLPSNFVKELFEFEGTIGSFSDRIKIAYALGIFGNQTYNDLKIIRALRNAFAHQRKPMQFATLQIAGMCQHLRIPDIAGVSHAPHAYYEQARDLQAATDKTNPKTRYVTACHSIAIGLLTFANQNPHAPFDKAMLP